MDVRIHVPVTQKKRTGLTYIIKIKIHSSCEIEYFVETHLCKLCVILRSRVLRVVCPHSGHRSATPLATTEVSYQGQQGDVRQSVRGNYKTRF